MIKVNSYPQELRLPTLPDEAKAPKSNPQPLDQYQETAPLLGDFGKFSSAETGNAILTNRILLKQQNVVGDGADFDKTCKNETDSHLGPVFDRHFEKVVPCPPNPPSPEEPEEE